jgi:hypothetical protein
MFRRDISHPSSDSKSIPSENPPIAGIKLLLLSVLTSFSTLMMEAKCSLDYFGPTPTEPNL